MDEYRKEMLESIRDIRKDQTSQSQEISDIKVTLVKNTQSLEEHTKRTEVLEQMVLPIHEERLKKIGRDEYKAKMKEERKERRQELLIKLKWPATIITLLGVIAGIVFGIMDL